MSKNIDLEPFNIELKIVLSLQALNFFSPMNHEKYRTELGQQSSGATMQPFSVGDFLNYLKKDSFPDAWKFSQAITELLKKMERADVLVPAGIKNSPGIGNCYYFFKVLTEKQKLSKCWLAKAIGYELLPYLLSSNIVQITGKNSDGDIHAGSGIFINPSMILTCGHVLIDMNIDEIQIINGQKRQVVRYKSHSEIDVGIVEMDSPCFENVNQVIFAEPKILEEVYVIGFPRIPQTREAMLITQRGEINSTNAASFDGSKVFFFSAIARPGNSGGPIISTDGHVVGIVTQEFSFQDENSFPFYAGVPTSEIQKALKEIDENIILPLENYE